MSILCELKNRFRGALAGLTDDLTEALELVRRSQDPKFGDYQANFAMPLGKRLRRPPREVAAEVIGRVDLADLCQPPEIAGPGFINLRIKDEQLAERLSAAVTDPRLGIEGYNESRWILLDYGDVVVHLFEPELRAYYALEDLWGHAKRVPLKPR